MTKQKLLEEIRQARLDHCPITVETIVGCLERMTDNTAQWTGNSDDMAVAILRGQVRNPLVRS